MIRYLISVSEGNIVFKNITFKLTLKMEHIGETIKKFSKGRQHFVSREFQDFAYRLCQELSDNKHKSLYMKLAKEKPRALLLKALEYVSDYPSAKNKGALFMWKLKDLEKEVKQ